MEKNLHHFHCLTARCTNLSTPTGENVTMSTTGSVTQAEFTCAAGYTISGTSLLTCNEFGDWDFSAPTCGLYR